MTASAMDAPAPLEHKQILVVFGGLVLVMLLAALDSTIVATALPTIVSELGGLERLAWVVTAYLLAQTIVTPLYGKLGDLYGRKPVLQSGIVLFLIGSALCGVSRSMTQLIIFRAIQGLGGGGLAVSVQAIIGDLVSPRERGRYQGIFGAVFGVASIAGPLLGGFFTTHLSWRWIFYVNLPLGILALVVLQATIPAQSRRVQHAIDYLGAALLAVALSALVLVTDLAGSSMSWSSAPTLALAATAVIAIVLFAFAERRAKEPVLPLHLFRDRTFVMTSAIALIIGIALFGSVTYLPLFLQVVHGASPTGSGLEMLPMMGGMLVTSIASGQIISRTGRYKIFPILGTGLTGVGLFLLAHIGAATTLYQMLGIMLLLGFGMGLVMQVLVVAVQNAVAYEDLGVATSGATLFRLIGGSLGTAILGAIFAARLSTNMARVFPNGTAPGGGSFGSMNAAMIARMPPEARDVFKDAFSSALDFTFFVAMLVAVVGFVLTWLVPEKPLRETVKATAGEVGLEAGETFPMPTSDDTADYLAQALAVVADRDVQREHIERIVKRAGVELSPAAAWLLVELGRNASLDPVPFARANRVSEEAARGGIQELERRGLVVARAGGFDITPAGCEVHDRLVAARRARLAELFPNVPRERYDELQTLLSRLARELRPVSA